MLLVTIPWNLTDTMKPEDLEKLAALKAAHAEKELVLEHLQSQLEAVSDEMERLEKDAYKLRFGLEKEGTVTSAGVRYIVMSIQHKSWQKPFAVDEEKPWLCVRRIKKDGSLGEREVTLHRDYSVEIE